jgi:hypothetical protein
MQNLLKTKLYFGEDQRDAIVWQTVQVLGIGLVLGIALTYFAMRTPTAQKQPPVIGGTPAPVRIAGMPPGVESAPPVAVPPPPLDK